jgi:hypothetical protein
MMSLRLAFFYFDYDIKMYYPRIGCRPNRNGLYLPEIVSDTTEEPLYRLSLPLDSKSTLCFFAAPNELVSMYRSYIFPIFERYGLTPITASDITSHNQNIMAVTASLIERAIMVIIDISSTEHSYKFEIDLALNKNRRITIIREKGWIIDPNIVDRGIRIFDRPRSTDSEQFMTFITNLEAMFGKNH